MAVAYDPARSEILKNIVREVSDTWVKRYEQLYTGAMTGYGTGNIDTSVLQMMRMSRIEGTLPEVPNKMDVSPTITPPDMQPLTVVYRDFRGKFIYLTDDEADDMVNYYAFNARGFAESIERTKEYMGHEIFNRHSDPTLVSGWDNLTLANAAHQLAGGGTYSNILPALGPSEALLEQVYDYFSEIPTDGGWFVKENSFTIVCSIQNARRWKQIIGAVAISHPFNTATTANQNPAIPSLFASEDGSITIVGTQYLVNKDDQFFIANGHELFFKTRWAKQYTYKNDDPEGTAHVAKLRLVSGWGDARRVLVSAS